MKLIFSAIKFLFIYITLGSAALLIVFMCDNIVSLATSGWDIEGYLYDLIDKNLWDLISSVKNWLLSKLPFCEVADKMMEDSGGLINIFIGFNDNEKFAFNAFLSNLFPDTVKLIVANLVIFLFARINTVITKIYRGFTAEVAVFISMGIFGVAGYSISIAALDLIDLYVPGEQTDFAYVAIAVLCFFVHCCFLSGSGALKTRFGAVFKYLFTGVIFGVINSILCWFVCYHLDGLYQYASFEAFVISFILYCIALAIEKRIT